MAIQFPTVRMRRLRYHPRVRDLVREAQLSTNDLILPLFIREGEGEKKLIKSMPGQYQLTLDYLDEEVTEINNLGIPAVVLFGIPKEKNDEASAAYDSNGIVQQAIGRIKQIAPELLVISDVCLCDYTAHGHCGVMNEKTGRMDLDNDPSLDIISKVALSYVRAGADMIAPSGNLDGMVGALRRCLDEQDYSHIPIMSYSTKFASGLYGPFRDACDSAPAFGDRKTYQMDPANGSEALRETELDIVEGADILMVKPATLYLDLIYRVKQAYPGVPLAAYHVSGEYSQIKAAAANGWIDEQRVVTEALISIKRAGADMILTYFAKEAARWMAKKSLY